MSRAKSYTTALLALVAIAAVVMLIKRDSSPPHADDANAGQVQPTALAKPTLVGREVCKECHRENFDLHAHSGHAHTFGLAADPKIAEKFVGRTFDAGEPFGSFEYFSDAEGLHARRLDGLEDETHPLQYALGSGEHAITLLSLFGDPNEGTIGIEHRVTFFGTDDELGFTPGHSDHVPQIELELFGVAHFGEELQNCVSCHNTSGTVVDQKIVDLVSNVNCEKCHGPGSEHVRQARQSETPPPWSIGRADWTTESEIRLCGSCHRMPQDMSRKRLREYAKDLIRFQPIGLLRSECYLQSEGELKCTSCHNPHMAAKAKTGAAYVQDCIDCHLEDSQAHVACPVSPTEGCIECHMPGIQFEHGVTFHDHWIRVIEDESVGAR